MAAEWYYLDPDNRIEDPKGLHCCRCKRSVKKTFAFTRFFAVDLHPEHPWVRKNPLGEHLIGEECWKIITKDGPVNPNPHTR